MKIQKKITNGILLIIIGILHMRLGISPDGFGKQFWKFSESCFFRISGGMSELPAIAGKTDFASFTAFWFFYFGLLLIPLGVLVHSIEREGKALPLSFLISYIVFILIGCYMVPNSGMTLIMLPHAVYMLIINHLRARR